MDVPLKLAAVSAKKDFKLGNVTAEDTQWLDLASKESEVANLPYVLDSVCVFANASYIFIIIVIVDICTVSPSINMLKV